MHLTRPPVPVTRVSVVCSPGGLQQVGLLCYQPCPSGYTMVLGACMPCIYEWGEVEWGEVGVVCQLVAPTC